MDWQKLKRVILGLFNTSHKLESRQFFIGLFVLCWFIGAYMLVDSMARDMSSYLALFDFTAGVLLFFWPIIYLHNQISKTENPQATGLTPVTWCFIIFIVLLIPVFQLLLIPPFYWITLIVLPAILGYIFLKWWLNK